MPRKNEILALLLVVLAVVVTRILPHPYNFTPLSAVAVYAGMRSSTWLRGFIWPLLALLVSDAVVMSTLQREYGTFTSYLLSFTALGVYGSFALLTLLGRLNRRWHLPFVGLALSSSLIFYSVSNFFVWLSPESGYPHTPEGLAACMYAGIPFYKQDIFGSFFFNQIFGDLFYFSLVFGLEHVVIRRWQPA